MTRKPKRETPADPYVLDRYVPRAYRAGHPGWGVFDQQENRFVTDEELARLTVDEVKNAKVKPQ